MDFNKTNNSGFTLIELIAALGLWVILLSGIFVVQWHSARVSAGLTDKQNAMENARVAVDMLAVNLQMAERFQLNTDAAGNLSSLRLYQLRPDACPQFSHENCINCIHPYVFNYLTFLRRLNFSGNELASGIDATRLIFCEDTKLMHISVTADDFTLETWVDLRFKHR